MIAGSRRQDDALSAALTKILAKHSHLIGFSPKLDD